MTCWTNRLGLWPQPLAQLPQPLSSPQRLAVLKESGENGAGEPGEREAFVDLVVGSASQLQGGQPPPVVAPDFWDAELSVDRQFGEGRAGDVDLDHQVGRRVRPQVDLGSGPDAFCILDVEARIGV